MNVQLVLSLCVALIMSPSCGETQTGSHEDEAPTTDYDYSTFTPDYNYDYDYTATFDYYYVTGVYEVQSKGSVIGGLTPALLVGLAVLQMCH